MLLGGELPSGVVQFGEGLVGYLRGGDSAHNNITQPGQVKIQYSDQCIQILRFN